MTSAGQAQPLIAARHADSALRTTPGTAPPDPPAGRRTPPTPAPKQATVRPHLLPPATNLAVRSARRLSSSSAAAHPSSAAAHPSSAGTRRP